MGRYIYLYTFVQSLGGNMCFELKGADSRAIEPLARVFLGAIEAAAVSIFYNSSFLGLLRPRRVVEENWLGLVSSPALEHVQNIGGLMRAVRNIFEERLLRNAATACVPNSTGAMWWWWDLGSLGALQIRVVGIN